MKTAIDSSALLAILNGEPDGEEWMNLLIEARRQGRLVICDIVYSEVAPAFLQQRDFDETLATLGIGFEAIGGDTAWFAGQVFQSYRRNGGPRERLIPDFLIAAHAQMQSDQLLAADRGYLRRYFKSLKVLSPK